MQISTDRKAYLKRWRENNKDRFRASINRWRKAHPERVRELNRLSEARHPERKKFRAKLAACRLKDKVMRMYGTNCPCGESELAVLSIDHKFDTGADERRSNKKLLGIHFYRLLAKSPIRDDLQVLCMNCQYRKRFYGPNCL